MNATLAFEWNVEFGIEIEKNFSLVNSLKCSHWLAASGWQKKTHTHTNSSSPHEVRSKLYSNTLTTRSHTIWADNVWLTVRPVAHKNANEPKINVWIWMPTNDEKRENMKFFMLTLLRTKQHAPDCQKPNKLINFVTKRERVLSTAHHSVKRKITDPARYDARNDKILRNNFCFVFDALLNRLRKRWADNRQRFTCESCINKILCDNRMNREWQACLSMKWPMHTIPSHPIPNSNPKQI